MPRMFQSIRLKFSLFVFLLLVLTTLLFSFATVKTLDRAILNQIINRAESLSRTCAAVTVHSLLSGDHLGMDQIVFKGKESNKDINYMAIVDTRMTVLVHSDVKKRGETLQSQSGNVLKESEDGTAVKEIVLGSDSYFEVSTPVIFKDKRLGAVFVGVNQSALVTAQRLARKRILMMFGIILIVGLLGIFMMSYFITRPIRELSSGVEELKSGRTRPLRVFSKDELGHLTESFNRMSATISDQREELSRYTRELEEAYISILRVLAVAIDARDPYTLGHSARVALHSVMIGEEIGLSKAQLEELEIASLFHDVGKLKTPDAILFKSRSLDLIEYDKMRHHPEDGATILKKVKSLQKYGDSVRHHHEYFNGRGYPDGLDGDKIPLYSAIISIADSFDAMTSTRPYREAKSKEYALKELQKEAGNQFNPDLVRAFIRSMEIREESSVHSNLSRVL